MRKLLEIRGGMNSSCLPDLITRLRIGRRCAGPISFWVSASNTNINLVQFAPYGESEYLDMIRRLAKGSKLSHALGYVIASAMFVALAGLVLLFFFVLKQLVGVTGLALALMGYAFAIALSIKVWSFVRIFSHGSKG